MRKLRIMLGCRFVGAAVLVLLAGAPQDATAQRNPQKASIRCRKVIGKSILQVVTAGLKTIQRCHVQRLNGRSTGDCNSLSGAQAGAFSRAVARAGARMNVACKAGDPVLANYGNAPTAGAVVDRILPAIQRELEKSGAELQDSPTFDGDRKSVKARRKCHGMLGTGRTMVIQSVLKSATKCQQRIDKRAQSFGPIDPSCLGSAGGAGGRASGKITRACNSFAGGDVGSCASLPGCLVTSTETTAQLIARLTYGGPAVCGNGLQDPGESCDDGNTVENDGCTATCQTPTCGDLSVNAPNEECDDPNPAIGGDRPDQNCYLCRLNVCGDGNVDSEEPGIELCDDGNTVAGDGCTNCAPDARTCGPNGLAVTLALMLPTVVGDASGTGLDLRYPGYLSIPGSGAQPSVRSRVTSLLSEEFTVRPSDRDTNGDGVDDLLRTDVTSSQGRFGSPGASIARVQFDCSPGTAVQPSDLTCAVTELVDTSGLPFDPALREQASCEVTVEGDVVTTTTTSITVTTTSTPVSTTTTTRPALCGNGVIDLRPDCSDADPNDRCEECDDGNDIPNDGCTNSCTICGNGIISLPETCDDMNLTSGDNCPDTCQINQCEPTGDPQSLTIVSSRPDLTSILLLLDYPDGRMEVPGLGTDVIQSITNTPGESADAIDLGIGSAEYALRLLVSASFTFDTTTIANVSFRGCAGAPGPSPGDFQCTVLEAADGSFTLVPGVTCSVTIP